MAGDRWAATAAACSGLSWDNMRAIVATGSLTLGVAGVGLAEVDGVGDSVVAALTAAGRGVRVEGPNTGQLAAKCPGWRQR